MKKIVLLTTFSFFIITLFGQRTINGKVTDDKGNPIQSASVEVKGTQVGTSTKADGTYSLLLPENGRSLIFSYIGMDPVEMLIGSTNTINATLSQTVQELAAVVVQVPYGTIKKTAFTGSETTVNYKMLEKQQVISVTKALEGLVPGVVATNGGGVPGSNAAIRIRGIGSVNASSSPLYVLNGVPYDGVISSISIDDIESVTVLKDAAAAALYGSRAANGVIMITTKKGKKGRTALAASVRQSYLTRGIPEYDRVGPKDYYELMWEAIRNSLVYGPAGMSFTAAGQEASQTLTDANHLVYNAYNVPGTQLVDPVTGKLNANAQLLWTDSWEDELYRVAPRTNANLSISGAGDKNDYFLSVGYLDEKGTAIASDYKRYNARIAVNTEPASWINAGVNIDGAFTKQNNYTTDNTANLNPFYWTRQMGPIYPVWLHDASGNIIIDPATGKPAYDWGRPDQMGARPYAGGSNLVALLMLNEKSSRFFNGNGNGFIEVKFLKGFSFKTTVGLNYFDSYGTTFQNSQFGDAQGVGGRSIKTANRQLSMTINEVLAWDKTFGSHSIRVMAGHENYDYQFSQAYGQRTGFPFPGTTELNTAATLEDAGSYSDRHKIESYFSSINYDFDQKYLLSGSFRRDGTSRFFVDNRWGNFYSAGAGWRISQESFLQNVAWLNELKLKASYGQQGNEDILFPDGSSNYYAYQNLYALGWNNVSNPGAVPAGLPNPELVWEGNKVFNVGADFVLFKNRLQGTLEFFNRVSDNLLFDVPLPPSTGNDNITKNIGSMKNTGVELQLGYNMVQGKNFDWRVDVNLTHFKNEITKLPQDEIINGTKKLMVGRSIYDFWVREYAGVDAATGDALFYKDVLDASGKPTGQRLITNNSNNASLYYKGSAIPDLTGGLTNSLRYKDFELSFLLTFSVGGKFYDGNYASIMHMGDYGYAWSTDILKRWQKPGDITNVPRVQNSLSNQNPISTRYLFDGSYLNIKNVTLNYNLPKALMGKLGLSSAQIYANVDNAWLFTTKKGMDPQRSFTGTSAFTFPPFRTMTIGVNLNL
jgi:TonB-linked SusC/RagA family outer membrane protein